MTFKELRERSGMTRTQFAEYFGIPYRTIQNWELGLRECPEYLLKLIKFRLDHEKAQGRWIPLSDDDQDEGIYVCSVCWEESFFPAYGADGENKSNFCPHCGADMERGSDNEADGRI